jgi:hypothetical protein
MMNAQNTARFLFATLADEKHQKTRSTSPKTATFATLAFVRSNLLESKRKESKMEILALVFKGFCFFCEIIGFMSLICGAFIFILYRADTKEQERLKNEEEETERRSNK